MQKTVLTLFMSFLLFGMLFGSASVLADENNSGTSENNAVVTTDDQDEDDETKTEIGNGKERIKERIREKDGRIEREVKGRFVDENGNEVKFERKIKAKDGKVEIETKLKIRGSGSNLSVEDSEGRKHRVRVTPEKLRALMLKRFNADNVTNFSLEEVKHKNIPRVVYKINSEHPGRFLGIFKIALRAETQVDPETGEVLATGGPWWAFLVAEQLPDEDEVVGNETLAEEVVADDVELNGEFEDVEVDEGLKIKAETLNGNVEIDIEVEFDTELSNTDEIVSEILNRITLSSDEIDGLLEMEVSDEPLENNEGLEFETETKDGSTKVEFDLQFLANSDSREDIVSAITEKISTLTSEQIKSALDSEDNDSDEDEEGNETEDEDDEVEAIALN